MMSISFDKRFIIPNLFHYVLVQFGYEGPCVNRMQAFVTKIVSLLCFFSEISYDHLVRTGLLVSLRLRASPVFPLPVPFVSSFPTFLITLNGTFTTESPSNRRIHQ